jgi:hypothetical protein
MKARLDVSRGIALLLGNAAVLALLLGLVWAGGEIYYRFWFDSTDSFGLTMVSKRWFERHYHFNWMQTRDDVDYTMRKVDSRRRITFLGDSFTAGHGIPEVGDRFANRIRRAHIARWEVHVLAFNGHDTGQELELLQGVVDLGYELDVLVLVYVLNDISDIVPEWTSIITRIHRDEGHEGFVFEHSYFANELYYRWRAASDPDIGSYYSFLQKAYQGEIWEAQKQRLTALHDLCAAHGAQLVVVTFPLLHALGPDYSYRPVHAKLGEFWAGLSVPHLDLYDVFAGYASERLVIGKYDAHPNLRAHEIAADAIGAFLERRIAPRALRAQAVERPVRNPPPERGMLDEP